MNNFFSILREKGGRITWSEDQIQYIVDDYTKNYSTGKLAKEFGVATETIRSVLRRRGVKILNTFELRTKDFPRNSHYFDCIDSPDKAYWLGFLYADAYISKDGEIRLNLSKVDESHLLLFLKAIEATNHHVKYSKKVDKDKTYHTAYIGIKDKYLVKALADLGCGNNKSFTLTFPTEEQVPSDLISHFIRGYFDGDGTLHYTLPKTSTRVPNYRIGFLGTEDMVSNIRKHLGKDNLALEKRGKIFALIINGNKQLESILAYIYQDSSPETRLARKKEIYDKFLLQRIGGEPVSAGCE